ncbi:Uncharacterized iron-regulated membrane protein [Filimonas lacunae]|uniref:Uncharacterized iron-regulated membrane protein n=1 Tax=Filimonas lacunae TaxID=477680 RepID=A0A173MC80_9BACT|nr:PepSY-associated TM helix domain-containing protein [Filimonas lacunae]BAV05068.1 iron-regulated membrane protein [Filimonas lacunae]SIT34280.1 Uncharacterized iron-regulated membrane protein [Filimonas lacunae]
MQKKKRNIKYWIHQAHLWLGFISGLVVFVVAITGCIFAFQKEITEVVHKDRLFVAVPKSAHALPVSVLLSNAKKAMGDSAAINFVTAYKQPDRTWEFMAYEAGDSKAFWAMNTIKNYRSVHLNPYTGKVAGVTDYKYDFFVIIKSLHWGLLLNDVYGQQIVGWSTMIFVVLLITGLVLWWPKKWNKANAKQRFSVKWDARWRRVNYDLHSVFGFYALLIGLVLALTGLTWAFQWFNKAVYTVAAGTSAYPEQKTITSVDSTVVATSNPMDIAMAKAWQERPEVERIGLNPVVAHGATIDLYCYRGKEIFYDYDAMQFDQYSGKLLHIANAKDKNRGEKLTGMNYDIHVGAIAGLPGKILAFIASLIAASLPVTGVMLWWGRRNKSSHRQNKTTPVSSRLNTGMA